MSKRGRPASVQAAALYGLMLTGKSRKAIVYEMGVSVQTIQAAFRKIMQEHGVATRIEFLALENKRLEALLDELRKP